MNITPVTPQELEDHLEDVLGLDDDPGYEPLDEDSYKDVTLRWIRTFVDKKTADSVARNRGWFNN